MFITEACSLLEKSKDLPRTDRWNVPFPMGVFGTLRKGHWNARRMEAGKIETHSKAFMPHFIAHGLSISFEKEASAPFEIYTYTPDEWAKMIPGVDNLEGFSPAYADEHRHYGYFRTLAWLHVLPDDFRHPLFDSTSGLSSRRDLRIKPDEWNQYPRVPCWVYSGIRANDAARLAGVDTVIWG